MVQTEPLCQQHSAGLLHCSLLLQALAHIAEASDPSATHNCWAFKVGGSARSNDDGEPGGTAGKPILGAIEGDGLEGVCVLVIR